MKSEIKSEINIFMTPKWLMPWGYGFTLYKWVFIRKDAKDVDYVTKHELVHVEQWTRIGFFKFPYLYIRELIRVGYRQNIYEIEAREKGSL